MTKQDIQSLANSYGLAYADLAAVLEVESGGKGFADDGKIIIQFEPAWFKRKAPFTPSGKWSVNGVERQAAEWEAFNDAFSKNPDAAMESTSIGLMQVMGFHYKLLGFKTVGEMWEYAKVSEYNQLDLGLRFIKSNGKMFQALKKHDFENFAYYYNGSGYKKFKYHIRMLSAYNRHKKTA